MHVSIPLKRNVS